MEKTVSYPSEKLYSTFSNNPSNPISPTHTPEEENQAYSRKIREKIIRILTLLCHVTRSSVVVELKKPKQAAEWTREREKLDGITRQGQKTECAHFPWIKMQYYNFSHILSAPPVGKWASERESQRI